jgi:hypothetical protein
VLHVMGSHRYAAWLAVLALTFILAMPTLTRLLPVADATAGADATCPYHLAADSRHSRSPSDPSHVLEWCGYCFLLHHSPLLDAGVVFHPLTIVAQTHVPAFEVAPDGPYTARLGADPRGPPTRAG